MLVGFMYWSESSGTWSNDIHFSITLYKYVWCIQVSIDVVIKLILNVSLFANSQLSQKKHGAGGTSRGCSVGPALEEGGDCSHDISDRCLCNLFLKISGQQSYATSSSASLCLLSKCFHGISHKLSLPQLRTTQYSSIMDMESWSFSCFFCGSCLHVWRLVLCNTLSILAEQSKFTCESGFIAL